MKNSLDWWSLCAIDAQRTLHAKKHQEASRSLKAV